MTEHQSLNVHFLDSITQKNMSMFYFYIKNGTHYVNSHCLIEALNAKNEEAALFILEGFRKEKTLSFDLFFSIYENQLSKSNPSEKMLDSFINFYLEHWGIDDVNKEGKSLIFPTSKISTTATLKLLGLGADAFLKNKKEEDLLMYSVIHNGELAKLILNNGYDFNAQNHNGMTTFIYACSHCPELVEEMLKKQKIKINAQSTLGITALIQAVCNQEELVPLLVQHGADVNQKVESGKSPLSMAIINGKTNTAKYLIDKGADIHFKQKYKNEITPFLSACQHSEEIAKLLLEKGVSIQQKDHNHNDALFYLSLNAKVSYEFFNEVVKQAKNLNVLNKDKISPLWKAAKCANLVALNCLLDNKAYPDLRHQEGQTVLMYTCARSQQYSPDPEISEKIISLLLKHGANINAQDERLETALHKAASSPNLILHLLKNGANPNLQDCLGLPSFSNLGALTQETLPKFKECGADFNFQDDYGRTVLMRCFEEKKEIFLPLLEIGVDFKLKDKKGNSVLSYVACVEPYDGKMIRLLLNKGMDINETNHKGQTPLMLLAEKNPAYLLDLINLGADIEMKDEDRKSFIDHITDQKFKNMYQKLFLKIEKNLPKKSFKNKTL